MTRLTDPVLKSVACWATPDEAPSGHSERGGVIGEMHDTVSARVFVVDQYGVIQRPVADRTH